MEREDPLFSTVLDRLREPTRCFFRGEDDWVNAYFVVSEFPPLWMMVGTDYTYDAKYVVHTSNEYGDCPIVLEEGETLDLGEVTMVAYDYTGPGPGTPELTLHLENHD